MSEQVGIDPKHLYYLDDLRESGVTNMFGASSYLILEFGLEKQEARETLLWWMKHFNDAAWRKNPRPAGAASHDWITI